MSLLASLSSLEAKSQFLLLRETILHHAISFLPDLNDLLALRTVCHSLNTCICREIMKRRQNASVTTSQFSGAFTTIYSASSASSSSNGGDDASAQAELSYGLDNVDNNDNDDDNDHDMVMPRKKRPRIQQQRPEQDQEIEHLDLELEQQEQEQQQRRHLSKKPIVQFIVIGNIENRRVAYFQSAVINFGCPAAKCISWDTVLNWQMNHSLSFNVQQWRDLLQLRSSFSNMGNRPVKFMIRIESTGENFSVEKKLIQMGAHDMYSRETSGMRIRSENVTNLTFDQGNIRYQRQWYLGFVRSLNLLSKTIDSVVDESMGDIDCRFMNHPEDIQVMFDKRWCHNRLKSLHIPVPRAFLHIQDHSELKRVVNEHRMSKSFIKLAHGSSASGVVAYSCLLDDAIERSEKKGIRFPHTEVATTSAELVRNVRDRNQFNLYNNLRVRRYANSTDVRCIVNTICGEGAIVEEWLPKAKYANGLNFDLRVVVIAGEARHFVVRTSKSPMTNLHLGNARGDNRVFLDMIQPESWERLKETCVRVARECFPRSLYMGIDVLVTPDMRDHYILEVNAFGDLIPRIFDRNMDTYHAEVQAAIEAFR